MGCSCWAIRSHVKTSMQISMRDCQVGGGGGGEAATGTFSREKCKLPFSCLTRKSCVSNVCLKCLEMPRTRVTRLSSSLNSAKRREEHSHHLQRSLRRRLICILKKSDPHDPLPLIMRCIRVDTAAANFHIKSPSQSWFLLSPVSHRRSPVRWRDAERQGEAPLCLTASSEGCEQ